MLYKLKDKYFLLSVFSVIMMLFIVINLIKLQIVDSKDYLAKSKARLSSDEVIAAPRGKILDRYGRPIVSNSLGFTVSFDKPSLTNDELNDLILNTVNLFNDKGDEYIDNFPIACEDGRFMFAYGDLEDEELDTKVRNFKFALDISDNLTAEQCIDTLAEKFGLDHRYTPEQMRNIIAVRYEMYLKDFEKGTPFKFCSDASMQTVAAIEENREMYSGISVTSAPVRDYVHGSLAAHMLGRVDIIYREEYEQLKDEGYSTNAIIGKDGIEKILENSLRGTDGKKSYSQTVGQEAEIKEIAAIPGDNAMLTIDIDLQRVAEEALEQTIESIKVNSATSSEKEGSDVGGGAVVVQDVDTGEILALANYPTFNPATFTKDYEKLSNDKSRPFFNRAISGTYPPGSVFKMLTTIAGLEEGVVTPYTIIEDKGQYEYYDQVFNCWIYTETQTTHGPMNATDALKNSCNYYYYELGKRLGVDTLVSYGKKLQLGQKTGIELEGEAEGVLASEEYKHDVVGEVWYPGDTLQMAIGQSYNLFTPLQLANYTSTIANGGTIYRSHLIKSVRDSETGEVSAETFPEVRSTIKMSNSTYEAVTKGMYLVSYEGTASSVFSDFPIETCSKTGSSQINGGSANGVFVSYAPYRNPKIAIAVVVENAGSGSVTAPIAKAIYTEYFKLNTKKSVGGYNNINSLIP